MNKYTTSAYILPSERCIGELRAMEVRFNDCHDPITGRFASKSGYSNVLSENQYNEGKNNQTTRPTDIKAYAGGGTSKNGLTKTASGGKIKKKTKYAPSPRRNNKGITVHPKTYAMLCGQFMTRYPDAQKGDTGFVYTDKMQYKVERDDYGGLIIKSKSRKR